MKNNMTFNIPTTIGQVISLIGNYSKINYDLDELSGWGNAYIWKFSNGLTLTAQSDGFGKIKNNKDEVRAFFLESSNNSSIENLVYGLALNKTNKNDCKGLFSREFKKSVLGNNIYKIYKDNIYTYLTFNSKEILIEIKQVTFDLEIAD